MNEIPTSSLHVVQRAASWNRLHSDFCGRACQLERHLPAYHPYSCTLCSSYVDVTMSSRTCSAPHHSETSFSQPPPGCCRKKTCTLSQGSISSRVEWMPWFGPLAKQHPKRYPGKSLSTQLEDALLRSRHPPQQEKDAIKHNRAQKNPDFVPESWYQDWINRKQGKPVPLSKLACQ